MKKAKPNQMAAKISSQRRSNREKKRSTRLTHFGGSFGAFMWLQRIATATSQTANAIIGGNPDESIGARAHREGWALERIIDHVWGQDHCKQAHERDKDFARAILFKDGEV